MKLLQSLFKSKQRNTNKSEVYKEEMVERVAREQFKKLAEKGLSLPVALL